MTSRFRKFFLSLTLILFSPLLSSCSSLFYYPSRSLYYLPSRLGYHAQELTFKAADGTQLYGWFFAVPEGSPVLGTIIQFHGNGENMSSHYLSLVWLVEQGYQLFTFDYRGYGKSQGDPDQKGTYQDGLAALAQAWEFHQKYGASRFIVYGQSLGGAIATRALEDFAEKSKVDLLVLDSTFVSYQSVARKKMASFWLSWPFSPLAGVLISDEYSAEQALKENKSRVLVIADREDPAVPFSCSKDFYPEISAPKEFWELNEGYHIGVFSDPHSSRRAQFLRLLDTL